VGKKKKIKRGGGGGGGGIDDHPDDQMLMNCDGEPRPGPGGGPRGNRSGLWPGRAVEGAAQGRWPGQRPTPRSGPSPPERQGEVRCPVESGGVRYSSKVSTVGVETRLISAYPACVRAPLASHSRVCVCVRVFVRVCVRVRVCV